MSSQKFYRGQTGGQRLENGGGEIVLSKAGLDSTDL